MGINRAELKQRSANLIRTSNPSVIMVGLAYLALSLLMYLLSARIMSVNYTVEDLNRYMQYVSEGNFDYAMRCLEDMLPPASAVLIDSLLDLAVSVVGAGFIIFLLNSIRNTGACLGNLLDGFGFFFKIIWLNILQGLFIGLWSMLFIVPGIIASYRYRMAIYLLVDNPQMSAMQCIRQSRQMMAGHKMELFVLDLSFFGWLLLSSLPVVGYAVQIWSVPYIGMTVALYYEHLSGRGAVSGDRNGSLPPPWEFDS